VAGLLGVGSSTCGVVRVCARASACARPVGSSCGASAAATFSVHMPAPRHACFAHRACFAPRAHAARARALCHHAPPTDAPCCCPAAPLPPQQKHPELSLFCNDWTYVRYLKARSWDLAKAHKMLQATLQWCVAPSVAGGGACVCVCVCVCVCARVCVRSQATGSRMRWGLHRAPPLADVPAHTVAARLCARTTARAGGSSTGRTTSRGRRWQQRR
jgi:hypothetical protein